MMRSLYSVVLCSSVSLLDTFRKMSALWFVIALGSSALANLMRGAPLTKENW